MIRRFRNAVLLSIIIIVGLCLGGCGLREQAREVDELLVMQTMGLDSDPRGVLLSLSSAAGAAPDNPPVRLQSAGLPLPRRSSTSVSAPMRKISSAPTSAIC